jgi:hypothetical protein
VGPSIRAGLLLWIAPILNIAPIRIFAPILTIAAFPDHRAYSDYRPRKKFAGTLDSFRERASAY